VPAAAASEAAPEGGAAAPAEVSREPYLHPASERHLETMEKGLRPLETIPVSHEPSVHR